MSWLSDIRNAFSGSVPVQMQFNSKESSPLQLRADIPAERQVDELLGLLNGVMADGIVHQNEVDFLINWLEKNKGAIDRWPANAIYPRLKAALSDGNLDRTEEAEIHDLIFTALEESESGTRGDDPVLTYAAPDPDVQFANRLFCFAGRFQSGNHPWCVSQVIKRGGMAAGAINQGVNYLVVGEGNRNRSSTKLDRKLARALKYRQSGAGIVILSERHWFEQLRQSNV